MTNAIATESISRKVGSPSPPLEERIIGSVMIAELPTVTHHSHREDVDGGDPTCEP